MAVTIQIKRKSGSNPTSLAAGELAFRTDTGDLFAGDGSTVQKVGSKNMLTTAGGTLTGYLTLNADPTSSMHAATKNYVDNVAAGLDIKASVRAATTANITLSGEQTIDGVSCVTNDRVLVKDQTTATQNGIYVVSVSTWSRAADFNTGTATWGAFTFVEDGSTNGGKGFVATAAGKSGAINIGTDNISFTTFSETGNYTIGNGLQLSGNTISVKAADTTISVDASGVKVGTIGSGNLGSQCVNAAALGAVVGSGLQGGAGGVISLKLADTTLSSDLTNGVKVNVIGSSNIAAGAVGTTQLAATSVTAAKLGSDVAGNGLTGGNGSALTAKAGTGITVDTNGINVTYGTAAGTACQGNDSRLHTQNTDAGTSSTTFYFGTGGLKVKTASSILVVRTNADDLYAPVGALSLKVLNNTNAYASTISGTVTADRTLTVPDLSGTILTDASTIDGGTW
jgi:hypothetical protein